MMLTIPEVFVVIQILYILHMLKLLIYVHMVPLLYHFFNFIH